MATANSTPAVSPKIVTKVAKLLAEYRPELQPVASRSEIAMRFDIMATLRLPIRKEDE
jgi:hypothetical protein